MPLPHGIDLALQFVEIVASPSIGLLGIELAAGDLMHGAFDELFRLESIVRGLFGELLLGGADGASLMGPCLFANLPW